MNDIELSAIDLNLLVALEALLQERSVTRAARRVGVGQSAMSHTLRRLRDLLDDPLLVRSGRSFEPTPRAVALQAPVHRVLREIERVLRHEHDFDPTTTTRTFRLLCPDALGGVVPRILARLRDEAPNMRLVVENPRGDLAEALVDGLSDLALTGPHVEVSGVVRRGLGQIEWAVMHRTDHPGTVGKPTLSLSAWLDFPHVIVSTGSPTENIVEQVIRQAGHQRTVGIVVPSFLMAPFVVAQTDYFHTMPRALAAALIDGLQVDLSDPPLTLPPVDVVALWPDRLDSDTGQQWFRETVLTTIRELTRG